MARGPATDEAVREFAGQLLFRLWRASHTRTAEALESLGLTTALFALLNVLARREGAIQQELGFAMGIDPSTMVSLIDQLEAAGLAQRRPRPTDRRAREVVITQKGRRTLKRARQLALKVEDEVLHGLTVRARPVADAPTPRARLGAGPAVVACRRRETGPRRRTKQLIRPRTGARAGSPGCLPVCGGSRPGNKGTTSSKRRGHE